MPRRIAALTVALATSACWVPADTGKRMQEDILALQHETQSAQKGMAEQREQVEELNARAETQIAQVESKLQELNRAPA